MIGTISGGCLDTDLAERAAQVRADRRCQLVRYDTRAMNDEIFGLGLGCGGEVEIWLEPIDWWRTEAGRRTASAIRAAFDAGKSVVLSTTLRREGKVVSSIERSIDDRALPRSRRRTEGGVDLFLDRVEPPRSMIVLGVGADVEPIARIAVEAGFHVTVVCEGDADLHRRRFPESTVISRPRGDLSDVRLLGMPAVLLVTHRTTTDREALRTLLPRIAAISYLGILGPRSRTQSLLAELSADGIDTSAELQIRIYGPAGLDLGSDAPGEIALSIVAEALAAMNGRSARSLRDRNSAGA